MSDQLSIARPAARQVGGRLSAILFAGAFMAALFAPLLPSASSPTSSSAPNSAYASPAVGEGAAPSPDPAGPVLELPDLLSDGDVELYRSIFALQEKGAWRKADKLIGKLKNPLLMGHVKFQRYMHPTAYRSSYKELHYWLQDYADHPESERLYKLAVKRHPKGWKRPAAPVYGYYGEKASAPKTATRPAHATQPYKYRSPRKRSKAQRDKVSQIQRYVQSLIRRDRPTQAVKWLDKKKAGKILDPVEFDQLMAKLAASYFMNGRDETALELASAAAKRSRAHLSSADWIAGLAAWRMGFASRAGEHFEHLARNPIATEWEVTAGAWWAARAYLVAHKPAKVNPLLLQASAHPRTFYGLLALRQLALDTPFVWDLPPLTEAGLTRLQDIPAARRAIALSQVGQVRLAEKELKRIYPRTDGELARSMLALASRLTTPAAALKLARSAYNKLGMTYDSALYPLPPWKPMNGFTLDRALVYAFMRQESAFNTSAKSHVGARGLMQLMPRTASAMAGDRSLRGKNRKRLFDPEVNMDLGQKYLTHLLELADVGDNLFHLAAAYNGGPGNLQKWRKNILHHDDPMLFIESIPSRETRTFIERVLTNFWMYRQRMDQPTPSLTALASGDWPRYRALDDTPARLAQNVRN